MSLIVGQSLRGYAIREFVHEGGFGKVYKAHQDSIFRDVAIKVIEHDQIVNNIDFIRRFEVEAQIIARLEHPFIVPIYDFWREPDQAFIVMRWLEGGSIRSQFAHYTQIDLKMLKTIIVDIGAALQFVHHRGIVHRDIKPDNILVDSMNNFYLSDFGIAIDLKQRTDTEILRIGTPDYMSPEQILYDIVTHKSDIYAFAILIFELLAQETPFASANMDVILTKHVNSPLPSILRYRSDLPPEIDKVLIKATAKSPDDRYQTIQEFVEAILPILDGNSSPISSLTVKSSSPTSPIDTVDFSGHSTATRILDMNNPGKHNPYKGLRAFDEADARDFYGRDAVVQQIQALLHRQVTLEQPPFIAVIGASGSGKSSIIRAGLIPELRRGGIHGSDNWLYITMTPGDHPILTLAEKLNSIAIHGQDDILDLLRDRSPKFVETIGQMVGDEHIFLLVDQFEELFTQVDEVQRAQFIEILVDLCKTNLNVTVVITLRADFYDKPLGYRSLGELIQSSAITVLPMSSDELEQVIIEPAKSAHCAVQPSLVSQLIADTVHQPNALPLLQFTITELYEHRDRNELTLQAYEKMGRLKGAIARRAETVFESLSPLEQDIAHSLFLQLVILLDNNETVRRRILWKDALQISQRRDVEEVINQFGDNRLLTFDREPSSRQPTIEVAHEALIQAWTRLQIWITENRGALITLNRLAGSVFDWLENRQDKSFLARDVQLLQYESLLNHPIIILGTDEQNFIHASQAMRHRNQMIRYMIVASLVFLTMASVVVTLIAIDRQNEANLARQIAISERDRANTEAAISQSRALAATALNSRDTGQNALLLAVAANTIADTFEARDSLANLMYDHRPVNRYFRQDIPLRDLVVTTDQQWVYAVGDSNQVVRLNLITQAFDTIIELGSLSIMNTVALNPDETLLAIGGQGGYVIADLASGEIAYQIQRDADVWALIWSINGKTLFGVDSAGAIFALDVASGDMQFDLVISPQTLFDIAQNPAGDLLAVVGADNIVYMLDSATAEVLYEFVGHSNWILSASFSKDGQLLATGGADLSVIVWDVENLQPLGQIPTQHTDWIRQVLFSPNGQQLLTTSADGSLKRWDVASGRQVGDTLARHTTSLWSASYLTDSHILSADRNGVLISWTLDSTNYPVVGLQQLDTQIIEVDKLDGVEQVAIATNYNDESASLFIMNLLTGDVQDELPLPAFVTSMDFSPEKQIVAIAGIDQTINLMELSNPQELISLGGHNSIVLDVAFAPDGNMLVSSDDRGTLILWDIATLNKLKEVTNEDDLGVSLVRYLNGEQILTIDRNGTMTIRDSKTLRSIRTVSSGHDGAVTDMLLDNDGLTLYTVGRDGLIVAWDTSSWKVITAFPRVHTDWILTIARIDASTLATTGRDGTMVLWDSGSRQPIGQPLINPSSDWGISILVDENGTSTYSLYRDGQIVEWKLLVADWIGHACDVANADKIPTNIQHLINLPHACFLPAS